MKITNEQLKQIIKEELSYVLHEEQEDKIQKLARYIRNGDKYDLFHGLDLLQAAELEPWSRADLYQAIKQHVDPIKEEMKSLSTEIYELREKLWGRKQTQIPAFFPFFKKEIDKAEKKYEELRSELSEIEARIDLSKFKTNSMVYVDDPTME